MNVRKWIFLFSFMAFSLIFSHASFAQEASKPTASVEKNVQQAASGNVSTVESARLIDLKGDVRIWTEQTKSWQKATVGQVLYDGGNKVATGKASQAVIAFDADGKDVIRIEESSEMVFRMIKPKESFLAIGSVLVKLDKVQPGARFKVITKGPTGRAYDVARRGNLMCVTGKEGTVRVFGVSEENRGGDFYSRSWWGDQRIFR